MQFTESSPSHPKSRQQSCLPLDYKSGASTARGCKIINFRRHTSEMRTFLGIVKLQIEVP